MRILEYLHEIHWFCVRVINTAVALTYKKKLIVNALVDIKWGKLRPTNLGDDLNIWLLSLISGKHVVDRKSVLLWQHDKNYICIGSIVGNYENNNSIICGTGAISENIQVKIFPKAILSTRGKLTRDLLLRQGLKVPENYGDLALLTSKYYVPKPLKKKRICIIPHYVDYDNEIIQKYNKKNHNEIEIVNLSNYKTWTDIIDRICSCDCVISSSLHGLIVSDSYSIPNIWVSFSNNIKGGYFKYLDYFSSVERNQKEPVCIRDLNDIEKAVLEIPRFKKASIHFECFNQIINELKK